MKRMNYIKYNKKKKGGVRYPAHEFSLINPEIFFKKNTLFLMIFNDFLIYHFMSRHSMT